MNKLEQARQEINRLDAELADLFEKRMAAAAAVAEYKKENKLPIYDKQRETELIKRNCALLKNGELAEYYKNWLLAMLEESKKYQRRLLNKGCVAYAGEKGAYAYIALKNIFPDMQEKSYISFEDAIAAVENGEAEAAVIPFENSYTGEVSEVLDILYTSDVYINRMYDLKIDHNLLCVNGASFSDIKQVYSHPQALSQCREFLQGLKCELVPYTNTAAAAKYISEQANPQKAAVASLQTASTYGLSVLAKNINTSSENTTRFAVVSKKQNKSGNRFSILFSVEHKAGKLAEAIAIISGQGFNMESIKSKSIKDQPWEYYFYAEIEGDASADKSKELLKSLGSACKELKLIGVYTK